MERTSSRKMLEDTEQISNHIALILTFIGHNNIVMIFVSIIKNLLSLDYGHTITMPLPNKEYIS